MSSSMFEDDNYELRNRFLGVTVGVVTNNKDPEKLGRIKVKLLNLDNPDYETDFIRMVTPMSGKGFGAFFCPNVGDEVLVAFGNGSIDRPYVIGSLWNKNFKPPYIVEDTNEIRSIKTQTGNEIAFNDTKDKETITIKTPKQLSITLDDEKQLVVIRDKGKKNQIKINIEKGELFIEAENKINLCAGSNRLEMNGRSNKISIKSENAIEIKSQQILIDASGTMNLKAGSSFGINCNGPTTINSPAVKVM